MREQNKYRLILLCCTILAVSGILVSVFITKDPMDGTRGGILAVGLTLGFVATRTDLAAKVYLKIQESLAKNAQDEGPQTGDGNEREIKKMQIEVTKLKQQFADLENLIKAEDKDEKLLNFYLVAATVIGTAVSAFGDMVCRHFI